MKIKLYIIFIIFFLFGCEFEDVSILRENNIQLTIYWEHEDYYSSEGNGENAKIYLYENEDDYNNPLSKVIPNQNLAGIILLKPTIRAVLTAHFDSLKPIRYWIRMFNSDNHERFVEHNQESFFTLQYPLIENTVTKVQIPSKRVYINSYKIEKIEFYNFSAEINQESNAKVEVNFVEEFQTYSRTLDHNILNIENGVIIYNPIDYTIDKFNATSSDPEYYINIRHIESSKEVSYEIKIFDLLNSNARLGNKFIKLNSNNEIEYIIYVSWNFN